jgi:tetratricopeptide (TPR) repeat protein
VAGFLFTFAGMKRLCVIGIFVLLVFAACTSKAKVPEPAVAEHGRSVEGPTSELSTIDSLIWQQPDSTLVLLLEYLSYRDAMIASSNDAMDTMKRIQCVSTTFDNHYAQLLASELLFKNYYGQSNRTEVLKAVGYFDSIVNVADGRNADARGKADTHNKADARGAAVRERDAFLAARAHYINGVGYYERDSLIEACGEYLNALRMMEGHFEEKVLVGHKARFMTLTYNRLGDLFSAQFMQEPAIYCCKKSLDYDRIAQASPDKIANTLLQLGKQFDKLKEYDSASYYYERILEIHPDNKTLLYRDAVCMLALSEYSAHHDTLASLDSLKRMASQAANEDERLGRFVGIGSIYQDMGQYDSAKVYLEPVLGKYGKRGKVAARLLRDIALIEGDTVKANQYAQFLIEDVTSAAKNQAQVSQLNELFQNYLQEKQEMALALERLEARRRNLWTGGMVALLAIAGLAVAFVTRRSHKKRLAAQEAEAQILNEEKQQLQARVDDALQQLQTVDDALQQLQTQADDALQQARAMLPQRVADLYRAKVPNRLERIMAEFEAAYPGAMERVAAAYPNLTKTETQLFVLSFLQFRAKEEADLLGLSQNTVLQYRSNLRKKTGNASISSFLEA